MSSEQEKPAPQKTPEQLAAELEAEQAANRKIRQEVKQQMVIAMLDPHPITAVVLENGGTGNLSDKILEYLRIARRTEGKAVALDRSMVVGIWSSLLALEKKELAQVQMIPVHDVTDETVADRRERKIIELRERKGHIALGLVNAFAHDVIPGAPDLHTVTSQSPRELRQSGLWDEHRDSIKPLSEFIAHLQKEIDPLRHIASFDPTERSIYGDTSTLRKQEIMINGITPEETAGEVLHNFNDVLTKLPLRIQFAQRDLRSKPE